MKEESKPAPQTKGRTKAYCRELAKLAHDPNNRIISFLSPDFDDELDAIRSSKKTQLAGRIILADVDLSGLEAILDKIGIRTNPDIPLSIRTKHLFAILSPEGAELSKGENHPHNLTNRQFKEALRAVCDPILLTEAAKSFAALTMKKDSLGNNILCCFRMDGVNRRFLVTMYGKRLSAFFFHHQRIIYLSPKIENASSLDQANPDRVYEAVSAYILGRKKLPVNPRTDHLANRKKDDDN